MTNVAHTHYGVFRKEQKATKYLWHRPEMLVVIYTTEEEANKALREDFSMPGNYYEVKPVFVFVKHIKTPSK